MSFQLEVLTAVLRWLLTLLGGHLVLKHILTTEQLDRFVTGGVSEALVWMPVGASLVWSLWAKVRSRQRFLQLADVVFGPRVRPTPDPPIGRVFTETRAELHRQSALAAERLPLPSSPVVHDQAGAGSDPGDVAVPGRPDGSPARDGRT